MSLLTAALVFIVSALLIMAIFAVVALAGEWFIRRP